MDMSLSLFRFNGSDRTIRITPELAARFGGMTLVVEEEVPLPPKRTTSAKTSSKTNSSKEG